MTESYPIEKNVPILPTIHRHKYPFDKLKVGESFQVLGKTSTCMGGTTCRWKKKLGWDYTIRRTENGCRVWRVA